MWRAADGTQGRVGRQAVEVSTPEGVALPGLATLASGSVRAVTAAEAAGSDTATRPARHDGGGAGADATDRPPMAFAVVPAVGLPLASAVLLAFRVAGRKPTGMGEAGLLGRAERAAGLGGLVLDEPAGLIQGV